MMLLLVPAFSLLMAFQVLQVTAAMINEAQIGAEATQAAVDTLARDLLAVHQYAVDARRRGSAPSQGYITPNRLPTGNSTSSVRSYTTGAYIFSWTDSPYSGLLIARRMADVVGPSYYVGYKLNGQYRYLAHKMGQTGLLPVPLPAAVPEGAAVRITMF